MSAEKPVKPGALSMVCWGLVYAALSLAEFLIGWAKSRVEKKLKGPEEAT